jgi:hypothetical protein
VSLPNTLDCLRLNLFMFFSSESNHIYLFISILSQRSVHTDFNNSNWHESPTLPPYLLLCHLSFQPCKPIILHLLI